MSAKKKTKNENNGKGSEIRITGGKYAGLDGWYNDARKVTKQFYYVCVKLSTGEEVWTKVKKFSVKAKVSTKPLNMAEAVLLQHTDVELHVEKAAMMMIKCKLGFTELLLKQSAEVFMKKMKEAHLHLLTVEAHRAEFCETNLEHSDDFEAV